MRAIVMELVEGTSLTGPVPMDDGLRIAKQIAEAIEYAHDRGIIHRDLKPANIKVTPDGTVKVLAYTSQQSGQAEIWVAAFPSFTNRRQVSSGGAAQPLWRGDGKELFFAGRDQALKYTVVKAGSALELGPVETLFSSSIPLSPFVQNYAVNHDGTRFYIREQFTGPDKTVEPLYIVTNWTSLVR